VPPIFHTEFRGEAKNPDGKVIQVPAALVLFQGGPRAQIAIGLAQPAAEELVKQGLEVPSKLTGYALIDTGASVTCVDGEAAASLHLPVVDVVNMVSASHASTRQNVYPISLEILGAGIVVGSVMATGAELKTQGLIALIGRDFLRFCTLHYNGVAGQFTLAV